MTTLSYSKSLVAGTPENINDVVTTFSEVKTVINGGLDNTNLAASAGVVDSKLAAPNNSVYKTLARASGVVAAGLSASTNLFFEGSFANSAVDSSSAAIDVPILYLAAADYAVATLATKLRIRAQAFTNGTTNTYTATVGLYPITACAGAAGNIQFTLGTVIAGSTVVFANQVANTSAQNNSGDFVFPSDSYYVLGLVLSATTNTNTRTLVSAQLQVRNV